ncbi:MAG: hypothetical protein SNH73_04135 [Rikenellaceae bacterium]
MKRLIIVLLAAVTLVSCFESTAYNTNCIVQPVEQVASGDDYVPLAGTKFFAFEGSTDEWYPLSYEDALEGVLTSVTTGEKLSSIDEGVSFNGASEGELSILLDKEEMILVAVDPASEIYGYRDYEVPHNLTTLYMSVPFLTWKLADYSVSSWTFVVPPFESLEYVIAPMLQADSDSEAMAHAGVIAYLFNGDSSEWGVSSYQDALVGKVASLEDPTMQMLAAMSAVPYGDSQSELLFTLTEGEGMIVVVDPTTQIYAWNDYSVDGSSRTERVELELRAWESESYSSEGWSFVIE